MNIERVVEFVSNHWLMSSGLFLVSVLLIQDLIERATNKHKTVSPAGAVNLLNDERTVVIDVREPHEFAKGHIENARPIPLSRLDEKIYEYEAYKHSPIIVTCQEGTRSMHAARKLTKQGFAEVYELKGGMLAWEDAKLPVSRKK